MPDKVPNIEQQVAFQMVSARLTVVGNHIMAAINSLPSHGTQYRFLRSIIGTVFNSLSDEQWKAMLAAPYENPCTAPDAAKCNCRARLKAFEEWAEGERKWAQEEFAKYEKQQEEREADMRRAEENAKYKRKNQMRPTDDLMDYRQDPD